MGKSKKTEPMVSTTLPIREAASGSEPSDLEHDSSMLESSANTWESPLSGDVWTPEHTTEHSDQSAPGEKTLGQVAAALEALKQRVDKLEASPSSWPQCLNMSSQIQDGVEDTVSMAESRDEEHGQQQTHTSQNGPEELEIQHPAQKNDCPNCHILRSQIEELEQKLHDQENRSKLLEDEAIAKGSYVRFFFERRHKLQNRINELESQLGLPATYYSSLRADGCECNSYESSETHWESGDLEEKLARTQHELDEQYCKVSETNALLYKALGDLGKAVVENESLRSELEILKAAASNTGDDGDSMW